MLLKINYHHELFQTNFQITTSEVLGNCAADQINQAVDHEIIIETTLLRVTNEII